MSSRISIAVVFMLLMLGGEVGMVVKIESVVSSRDEMSCIEEENLVMVFELCGFLQVVVGCYLGGGVLEDDFEVIGGQAVYRCSRAWVSARTPRKARQDLLWIRLVCNRCPS